jgi:hypothetical protein
MIMTASTWGITTPFSWLATEVSSPDKPWTQDITITGVIEHSRFVDNPGLSSPSIGICAMRSSIPLHQVTLNTPMRDSKMNESWTTSLGIVSGEFGILGSTSPGSMEWLRIVISERQNLA